jgi:hypothetical protein
MNELVRILNTDKKVSEDWSPASRPLLIILTSIICLTGFIGENYGIFNLFSNAIMYKLI